MQHRFAAGTHSYHRESETMSDCVMKSYANIAVDKETREALARIPDQINKYIGEHSDSEKLPMGFALRKPSRSQPFTSAQRQYLNQKFHEGETSKSKFDPRQLAKEMRDSFEPEHCLKWQQIASYFSARGRKLRSEKISNENGEVVIDNEGEILELPNDFYATDPNVGTVYDEVVENVDRIMDELQDYDLY